MSQPYRTLPPKAFWRTAVAKVSPGQVDPVQGFGLRIAKDTRVATAGSCFAQHIARYLREAGYHYYITEDGHPILPIKHRVMNNYGLFSARYGNIYTARQLIQLFNRAYGIFAPAEPVWRNKDSNFVDPFRPTTQPGGYISEDEMLADRAQHLAAVRSMFEGLDVFVFTLGLTECWRSKDDGAVFPLCPGVEGGEFDATRYEFYNQRVGDVIADMTAFLEGLTQVNPRAKVILTVSPVPLIATAQPDAHALNATTYSKSVLRVAAEELCAAHEHVHYFPSYEIITGSFSRGQYFAEDLRNVVEEGVEHVMSLFLAHATAGGEGKALGTVSTSEPVNDYQVLSSHVVEVECDEVALDRE